MTSVAEEAMFEGLEAPGPELAPWPRMELNHSRADYQSRSEGQTSYWFSNKSDRHDV